MKTKLFKILSMFIGIIMLLACAKDIEVFTGNIVGKVTDSTTGKVLQGVSISIKPSGNSQTTGSDGYFEFRHHEKHMSDHSHYRCDKNLIPTLTSQMICQQEH